MREDCIEMNGVRYPLAREGDKERNFAAFEAALNAHIKGIVFGHPLNRGVDGAAREAGDIKRDFAARVMAEDQSDIAGGGTGGGELDLAMVSSEVDERESEGTGIAVEPRGMSSKANGTAAVVTGNRATSDNRPRHEGDTRGKRRRLPSSAFGGVLEEERVERIVASPNLHPRRWRVDDSQMSRDIREILLFHLVSLQLQCDREREEMNDDDGGRNLGRGQFLRAILDAPGVLSTRYLRHVLTHHGGRNGFNVVKSILADRQARARLASCVSVTAYTTGFARCISPVLL